MLKLKLIFLATLLLASLRPAFSQDQLFIFFNVKPDTAQKVVIEWKIAAAADSLDLVIERSQDKISWTKIADIPFITPHVYLIHDTKPAEGLNYYRVKQVANKGESVYSDIKWVQFDRTSKLYLWPNPVSSILHIKTPFVDGSIDIFDSEGRFMLKKSITNFITDIPTADLAKGIYFLHIKYKKTSFVEKFVKD